MYNNWSDAVKRLIGNEALPCPICGMEPNISYEGNFLNHDLYLMACYHIERWTPPLITPLSAEISDCIRTWNDIVKDYHKATFNIESVNQEGISHDSFMEFLRSN